MLRLLVGVASGVSAAGADVTTLRGRVGAGWLAVAVGRLSVATALGWGVVTTGGRGLVTTGGRGILLLLAAHLNVGTAGFLKDRYERVYMY